MVSANGVLNIAGGTLTAGTLAVTSPSALVSYTSGPLNATAVVTSNGGEFNASGTAAFSTSLLSTADATSKITIGQNASATTSSLSNAGQLIITGGGQAMVTGAAQTNIGSVTLAGGTLRFTHDLTNASGAAIVGDGVLRADGGITNQGSISLAAASNVIGNVNNTATGSIRLSGVTPNVFFNDVVNDGAITIDAGSGATFYGTFSGAHGTTGGGTAFLDGPVSPGHGAALISFGGNVGLASSSSIVEELGGTTRGSQYDAIDVAGSATLAGSVAVCAINGFVPLPGQSFNVLGFASRSGDVNVINQTPYAGLHFNKVYSGTSLSLAASATAGDANLDGKVDVTDLGILATDWQLSEKNWLGADFSGDGTVDVTDLGLLATNWQFGVGSPGASLDEALASLGLGGVSIPEPTSVCIARADANRLHPPDQTLMLATASRAGRSLVFAPSETDPSAIVAGSNRDRRTQRSKVHQRRCHR